MSSRETNSSQRTRCLGHDSPFVFVLICSIERDAQLLANRIALLKQEEQKTWKKIDDTKKRTNEILSLKKRNEDRIQKVSD